MGKELSCGVEFMRGVLLFLNALFVLIGLALLGIGIYIKVDTNFASILSKLATDGSFEVKTLGFLAFVMIGGGIFTLIIALLGCIGALWNNRCLLFMYAIILILLMILELVAFILALVYKGKLKNLFEEPLFKILHTALENKDNKTITAFHDLENSMKCCGVHNKSDYDSYTLDQESKRCKEHPDSKGCSQAIIDLFSKNLPIVGGTLGGILIVELFGLIGACVLAAALKNSPEMYSSPPPRVFSKLGGRNY
ncbi:unnamed protein product [Rotaria sp. Silwood1]|nr:unnamed protein product [Rotaria sp. Silwood1]CAF3390637.1 unnamed protein product [Rotaria sp. Silwood1]CAF3424749.1 unnamed protein product [Rotaria sp. Silwood1]CAF3437695.1 unnamed protein product [Rotaria sp. Silwood1]CAF4606352.1 unnamed protein product [Rotaria sp. Silwood1]